MVNLTATCLFSIILTTLTATYNVTTVFAASTDAVAAKSNSPALVSAYVEAKGGDHTLVVGQTLQFVAYATYSDGSTGTLPDARGNKVTLWNTTNHDVAKISTLGHATALGAGTINIEGTIGKLIASPWTLTVSAPQPLIRCAASPSIIYQGARSNISAAGSSPLGLSLTYSYSATAGSIIGAGKAGTLNTAGAPSGVVVVSCIVNQAGGGTASATAEVLLQSSAEGQDISVNYPSNGSTVAYPAWVRANSDGCNGQQPVSFGYSVDGGRTLTSGITPFAINAPNASITAGAHTLYFYSSTAGADCPAVETTFTVTGDAGQQGTIPPNAINSGNLDNSDKWKWHHDSGTSGDSSGSSLYPVKDLSLDEASRQFYLTYKDSGGELFSVDFAHDTTSTHFVYDTYVYLADPSQVENVEMDMNQVLSDGETVILGTQCSADSDTWEWSTISGSGGAHWHASNLFCNPQQWAANTWHHVQIATHRDSSGVVTHDWVTFDGVLGYFQNASGPSAPKLGWGLGDMVLNFQLDGVGNSGSITAYIDQMHVYRW